MVRNTGGSFLLVVIVLSMLGLVSGNPRQLSTSRATERAASVAVDTSSETTSDESVLAKFIHDNLAAPGDEAKARLAHLQFTVAFVPDPVHTHLALFFDRTIEAVQDA